MIMMPAWSRMREDKKIECLACNMLIDNCSCVWAAIRDLQKVKDDIHLRMDNILQLHRNKFSGIQSDICKLIDELREHQKLPHSMPLYGRDWIKDKCDHDFKEKHSGQGYISQCVKCDVISKFPSNAAIARAFDRVNAHQVATEKATHAADAEHVIGKNMDDNSCRITVEDIINWTPKENPSRKVLEKKLHDNNLRILQLEEINSANKKRIEELECLIKARDVQKDRLQRDLSRMEERCRGCSYCKPMSGCCL